MATGRRTPSEEPRASLEPRRRPVQARGLERRQAILDATARLLVEVGFSGVTTNAVAAESGASIGTVYQYFPNKEALFVALLERYRQALSERLAAGLGQVAAEPWQVVVDRLFDVFVAFYRSEPGYRQLWLGSQLVAVLEETGREWGDSFALALAPALGALAPALPAARQVTITQVALHQVSALVTIALQAGGDQEEEILAEARLALSRYLAPYLDQ